MGSVGGFSDFQVKFPNFKLEDKFDVPKESKNAF